jgi:hypothetical protein
MKYNQAGETFGFDPDSELSLSKKNSALRPAVPFLIEDLPAVDNFAALGMRPSIPQKNDIGFSAPFDKGPLAAIIDEWHQAFRTAHLKFSQFNFAGKIT